ncbi:hypothetical protein H7691_06740 [Stenotrophomonas sp. CW117]|uniref:hypothetical protein n=1 Tax=Stenotrophomonas TaxID=40323 RepID=UPI001782121A|nr:hypothetical protein [Stenotrophomonas sp. CW117]QOF99803.1 hypothetical protein H7691_06740 [Stenotrophomonas sp. CW117]
MIPTASDDVEVLAPASTSVPFAGSGVEISPIRAGAIPGLIRTARPLLQALLDDNVLLGEGAELDVDLGQLLTLVGDHGDAFFQALAIATGIPEPALRDAGLDDVLRVAQVCIRVNRDFFTRNVAPLLAGLAKPTPGVGATPSSS